MERITINEIEFISIIYTNDICEIKTGWLRNRPKEIVCVKKLSIKNVDDARKYNDECLNMAKAVHPNIIRLRWAFFEGSGRNLLSQFIIMDYFPEGDLLRLLSRRMEMNSFWPENELLEFFSQLISAYKYLQTLNICHRDIKPQNIFVTNNGTKLIVGDFGSSRHVHGEKFTIAGTTEYLSPLLREGYAKSLTTNIERIEHNPFKSDVYSLGLVFLYMASLKKVQELSNLLSLPQLLQERISNLPPDYKCIKNILISMLAVNEQQRPDFLELEPIFNTIINNLQCQGCQKSLNIHEFYVCLNEKMCKMCLSTFEFFPENQMYFLYSLCSYCNQQIEPDMQCSCTIAFSRCFVCKNYQHIGKSCYDNLKEKSSNGLTTVKMVCKCRNLSDISHDRYSYFFCQNCGYFCVVCGHLYQNMKHAVCEYLLKYYYVLREIL